MGPVITELEEEEVNIINTFKIKLEIGLHKLADIHLCGVEITTYRVMEDKEKMDGIGLTKMVFLEVMVKATLLGGEFIMVKVRKQVKVELKEVEEEVMPVHITRRMMVIGHHI